MNILIQTLMTTFKSILNILNLSEKIKLIPLLILSILAITLETLSVGILIPLFTSIFNTSGELENLFYFIDINEFISRYTNIFNTKTLIFVIAFLYIIKNFFLTYVVFWTNKYTINISVRLSYELLKIYLLKPFLFHQKENSSNLIRNVSQEVLMIQLTIQSIINIGIESAILIIILFLLISINFYASFLLLFFGLILGIVFNLFINKYLEKIGNDRLQSGGIMLKNLMQSFGAIKDIKISSTENKFLSYYDKNNKVNKSAHLYFIFFKSLPRYFYEIFAMIIFMLILFIFNFQAKSSDYIVTILAIYMVSLLRLLPSLNKISIEIMNLKFRLPALRLVLEEFSNNFKLNNVNSELTNIYKKETFKVDKISLKNISFKYDQTKNVLENFSIEINKNDFIGISGRSGKGKSTLLNIITGLINPTIGYLKINDQSIEGQSELLKLYQSKIGYVSQKTFILDDTLEKNITMNSHKLNIDQKFLNKIIAECQITELNDSIDKNNIYKFGEMGSKLSGGQVQRIGIARSLYNNPEILILDEPTSSLDSATENKIIDLINSFKFKKTIILISHKSELLSECNKLINLDDL
jgi:ATP-binding cassette, subfamily B, bacterial PglK